jgi:hypothetical protein
MATTRTPIKRSTRSRITPEAIAVYKRARDLLDNHDIEKWEEKGGRRAEFIDASEQLDSLLDRKPWQTSIIDCVGEETAPDYVSEASDWPGARALLNALEEA